MQKSGGFGGIFATCCKNHDKTDEKRSFIFLENANSLKSDCEVLFNDYYVFVVINWTVFNYYRWTVLDYYIQLSADIKI
ncbi:MAG: hypothetical protein GX793_09215 [Bacteroidales bacterium]|nr:hypothetical protein [Bacteroidales bacterium]MCK9499028.1 hypothetical protein [Bacteroidales bacterium]MDY0313951.1 hypothetical protein [Bacteroidales bacterium]NLB87225.1 hypothetical protein [Bacteroidales bacterium]